MLQKIKNKLLNLYWFAKLFNDIRNLGLLVFLILALAVSWSSVKAIQTNYDLQKDIARLEQEVAVAELAAANQKLRNQYYNTDQFLELAARRQFGLGAPGEKLIVVPTSVALAHTVDLKPVESEGAKTPSVKPSYQRNFEAWINFFLHRPNSID